MKTSQGAKNAEQPKNLVLGEKHYLGKASVIDGFSPTYLGWFRKIFECLSKVEASNQDVSMDVEVALGSAEKNFRQAHKSGGRVIFIGNGGSAAIASHMAVDYTKNGGVRSIALNDSATLTCLANDFGYENVFAKQLEYQANEKDVVVVISSSGKSPNIINAAKEARVIGCRLVVTLTGMNPNNRLRRIGDINFYVPSTDYGLVEVSHLSLLHSMVGE